jgi:hypothetical protein
MKKLIFLVLFFSVYNLQAQDTLPQFSLINAGNNRIIVGWTNTLPNVKQISIQRSFDSLTGFKTILTVLDPTLPQNGFADLNATNDHMFYRLYILLDQGLYQFSKTKKPIKDTLRKIIAAVVPNNNGDNNTSYDSVRRVNPFVALIDGFPGADSVAVPNPVAIKNKPTGFRPSLYVYTYRDGNVRISLPDDEKPKKYSIKFFEDSGDFIFELKDIKERNFKLDKANFFHAGWFKFELYEDEKLIEKHKFYLEKDF